LISQSQNKNPTVTTPTLPETATLAKAYRRSLLPILSGSAFAILLLLAYLSSNSIISNFLQRLEAIPYGELEEE